MDNSGYPINISSDVYIQKKFQLLIGKVNISRNTNNDTNHYTYIDLQCGICRKNISASEELITTDQLISLDSSILARIRKCPNDCCGIRNFDTVLFDSINYYVIPVLNTSNPYISLTCFNCGNNLGSITIGADRKVINQNWDNAEHTVCSMCEKGNNIYDKDYVEEQLKNMDISDLWWCYILHSDCRTYDNFYKMMQYAKKYIKN